MTTYHVISSTGGSVLPTSSQTGKDFQFSYDLDTHNGSYIVEVLCDGKKRGTYTVHVSRQTAQLFDLNQNILLGLPFFGDYIFNGNTYHLPVDYTNFIAAIQGFYGVTVGIDTAHGLFFKTGGLGQLPSDGKIPVLFAHSLTLEGIHDNGDGTFTYFDRMGNDTSISVCKLLGDGDCDLFVLKVDGANTTIKAGDTTPDIVTKRAKIQYVAGVPQLTDDFGTTVNLPLVEIHPSGITYDPVNNRWDIVQNDGTHLYVTWADMLADVDFVGGLVSAIGGNTLVVDGSGKLYVSDTGTVARAWAKMGSSQATNADSVLVGDKIFHIGAINEGADFSTKPFNVNYLKQTVGNVNVFGAERSLNGFITDNPDVNVNIDPVNGDDNLDPVLYFTTGVFKTGDAALKWVNRVQAAWFIFNAINTSDTNRISLSNGFFRVTGKNIRLISGYYELANQVRFQNCFLDLVSTNIKISGFGAFDSSESKHSIQYSTIEHYGSQGVYVGNSTLVNLIGSTINYRANGQYLFFPNVSNIWQVSFAQTTINVNGFSGLSLLRNADIGDTAHLYLQEAQIIPLGVSVAGMAIHVGRTIVLGQTSYDLTDIAHSAVLYKQTPIRTPDLPSSAEMVSTKGLVIDPNGVFGWQTVFGEKIKSSPLVLLTDPFDASYNAVPSGEVYKVELQFGSSSYYQLFIKP